MPMKMVTIGNILVAAGNNMVTINNKLGNRWKQGKAIR